jgi:hypothetical protein
VEVADSGGSPAIAKGLQTFDTFAPKFPNNPLLSFSAPICQAGTGSLRSVKKMETTDMPINACYRAWTPCGLSAGAVMLFQPACPH